MFSTTMWIRMAWLAMLATKKSAGITTNLNLMILLHSGEKAHKLGDPLWLWNPGQTSPEVPMRVSVAIKKDWCPQKNLKRERKNRSSGSLKVMSRSLVHMLPATHFKFLYYTSPESKTRWHDVWHRVIKNYMFIGKTQGLCSGFMRSCRSLMNSPYCHI